MQTVLRRAGRSIARRSRTIFNLVVGRLAVWTLKAFRRFDPDRMADFAGRFMRRVGPWIPEHRIGRANLAAAYPDWSPAQVEAVLGGVWDNLGRLGAEFVHLDRLWKIEPGSVLPARIELSPGTAERFERLRAGGKPALIFAAHLGNWELPALAAATYGLDTAILFRRPNIPDLDRLVMGVRSAKMGTLIPSNLHAPVQVAAILERGTHVGMLVDQYYTRGVDITFFGRRTKANPLIARLARRIECPIHGTRVIRLPEKRFRIELTEAIEPTRDAQGEIDIATTMQTINSIIEGWIREHPEQWLWLHRRWR